MPVTALRYKGYRGEVITTTAEALLQRAQDDPSFAVPYPFLRSMLNPEARPDHEATSVSVTHVLKGCLSCKILQAYEPYTLDLDAGLSAWRGTQFHALLEEHAAPGDVVERRFWAHIPGTEYVVHGKPDIIRAYPCPEGNDTTPAVIIDLKTTQSVPTWDTPWADHVEQLMDYTWLVRHSFRHEGDIDWVPASLKFKGAVIWYMTDTNGKTIFKPLEVRRKVDVATKPSAKWPSKTVKEPFIWTDEEVEAILVPKVIEHCSAMQEYEESGKLPPYAPGFDFVNDFAHRYSPVAAECVRRHILEDGIALKSAALFSAA